MILSPSFLISSPVSRMGSVTSSISLCRVDQTSSAVSCSPRMIAPARWKNSGTRSGPNIRIATKAMTSSSALDTPNTV